MKKNRKNKIKIIAFTLAFAILSGVIIKSDFITSNANDVVNASKEFDYYESKEIGLTTETTIHYKDGSKDVSLIDESGVVVNYYDSDGNLIKTDSCEYDIPLSDEITNLDEIEDVFNAEGEIIDVVEEEELTLEEEAEIIGNDDEDPILRGKKKPAIKWGKTTKEKFSSSIYDFRDPHRKTCFWYKYGSRSYKNKNGKKVVEQFIRIGKNKTYTIKLTSKTKSDCKEYSANVDKMATNANVLFGSATAAAVVIILKDLINAGVITITTKIPVILAALAKAGVTITASVIAGITAIFNGNRLYKQTEDSYILLREYGGYYK